MRVPADRLAALVDALLGPGQPPRKEPVNIHELVQHVGHLLAAEAPTGVVVERDYDPSLPRLRLDRNQIIQALLNLIKNAADQQKLAYIFSLRNATSGWNMEHWKVYFGALAEARTKAALVPITVSSFDTTTTSPRRASSTSSPPPTCTETAAASRSSCSRH
mgnify:CR=1 FL=1